MVLDIIRALLSKPSRFFSKIQVWITEDFRKILSPALTVGFSIFFLHFIPKRVTLERSKFFRMRSGVRFTR